MNNILNNLIGNLSKNQSNNKQNTYPNFNFNSNNNSINSILALLLSGKDLSSFSELSNINPIISSILTNQKKDDAKKIESDKIDLSSLSKI